MLKKQIRICEVCGASSKDTRVSRWSKFDRVLCYRHYRQLDVHGRLIKTRYDDNDFKIVGEKCYMETYDSQGSVVNVYLFNKNHLEKVREHKWHSNAYSYATTRINKQILYLHDIISDNVDKKHKIDHIDGDPLNNLDNNLRHATTQQNAFNSKIGKNNKSGVTGVCWVKRLSRWAAQMISESKRTVKHAKSFDEAVKCRLQMEAKYAKEYSYNHNPDTNTIQLTYLSHDDDKQTFIEVDMSGNIIKFEKAS